MTLVQIEFQKMHKQDFSFEVKTFAFTLPREEYFRRA